MCGALINSKGYLLAGVSFFLFQICYIFKKMWKWALFCGIFFSNSSEQHRKEGTSDPLFWTGAFAGDLETVIAITIGEKD